RKGRRGPNPRSRTWKAASLPYRRGRSSRRSLRARGWRRSGCGLLGAARGKGGEESGQARHQGGPHFRPRQGLGRNPVDAGRLRRWTLDEVLDGKPRLLRGEERSHGEDDLVIDILEIIHRLLLPDTDELFSVPRQGGRCARRRPRPCAVKQ